MKSLNIFLLLLISPLLVLSQNNLEVYQPLNDIRLNNNDVVNPNQIIDIAIAENKGLKASAEELPPFKMLWTEPLVIRKGVDDFRLMLEVTDTSAVALRAKLRMGGRSHKLLLNGSEIDELELYDDGTHGDIASQDHIFTINGLSISEISNISISTAYFFLAHIELENRNGEKRIWAEEYPDYFGFAMSFIDPDQIPIRTVTSIADSIRRTEYVVSIEAKMGSSIHEPIIPTSVDIGNEYYKYFPDDRDFLVGVRPSAVWTGGANYISNAYYAFGNQNVSGIGLDLFDNSSRFGSNSLLQGFIVFNQTAIAITNTPEMDGPSFMTMQILHHEIGHRWAAFLDESLNLTWGPHWAVPWDSSYQDVDGRNRFNQLELYLAGLIPATEVESPLMTKFESTGVTIDDIIAIEGERLPNSLESQKHFRMSLVVTYDRPLSDIEISYFDFVMREFEKTSSAYFRTTFSQATGGRATMETSLYPRNNILPVISNPINDMELFVGENYSIDLRTVFSDENEDVLSFSVGDFDKSVVLATISYNQLNITAISSDTIPITIIADDGHEGATSTSFIVVVPPVECDDFYFFTRDSICTGDSYLWQGDYYNTDGTFHSNFNTLQGCDSIYELSLHVNSSYSFSESKSICSGDNYLGWTETGQYNRTLASSLGCDSVISTDLVVIPNPVTPNIILSGDTLISDGIIENQWYLNDNKIIGSTGQKILPVEEGTYYAIVTDSFGCVSSASNSIEVSYSFVGQSRNSRINIYPNPAEDFVTIKLDLVGSWYFKIASLNGEILENRDFTGRSQQIDLSSYQRGVYFITIRSRDFVTTRKIIKL